MRGIWAYRFQSDGRVRGDAPGRLQGDSGARDIACELLHDLLLPRPLATFAMLFDLAAQAVLLVIHDVEAEADTDGPVPA